MSIELTPSGGNGKGPVDFNLTTFPVVKEGQDVGFKLLKGRDTPTQTQAGRSGVQWQPTKRLTPVFQRHHVLCEFGHSGEPLVRPDPRSGNRVARRSRQADTAGRRAGYRTTAGVPFGPESGCPAGSDTRFASDEA